MPIQVTCPSCLKRFQVSDKFAGKTGPCPNCKKPLRVPDESEQVVIHAPEDDGPKDSRGESVLKPILRQDTDFTRQHLMIAAGAIAGVFFLALGFRFSMPVNATPLWAKILGVVLLAPPLVRVGYAFVREQELAPYTGTELRNRVLICSGLFASLWLLYAFIPAYVLELDRSAEMSWMVAGLMFCVMLGLGAVASSATFELELSSGLAHAGLYIVVVALVALAAGVPLAGLDLAGLDLAGLDLGAGL